jgi:hypothetical protein
LRKGATFALEPMLEMQRRSLHPSDFAAAPPIVVNSLPKSGTHLLLQITRAMPNVRYFGRFIATRPSLTLRERTPAALARRIARLMPAETVGAHLHYLPEVSEALERVNALHLFIYRDPRDVIVSEAHYLADMNRWHRMHKHFHKLPDDRARLTLALDGLDDRYPEANARLLPFVGWIDAPGVVAIRYEDLTGPRQPEEIARIVDAWQARGGRISGPDGAVGLVSQLSHAIDPGKSHTFREGGSGKWRNKMTPAEADTFSERLRRSITAFRYPV